MGITVFDRSMQEEYNDWVNNPPVRDNTQGEVAFLESVLELSKEMLIADLFCALGRHTISLTSLGYSVTGVDRSPTLSEKAKRNAEEAGVDCSFIVSDLSSMPFKNNVDVIFSIQSSPFEAWRKPEEILEMLSYVHTTLRPGGKYLFGWPHNWCRSDVAEGHWRRKLQEAGISDFDDKELPFYFYGPREQAKLSAEAAFVLQSTWNRCDPTKTYDRSKPGLIMLVSKRSERR